MRDFRSGRRISVAWGAATALLIATITAGSAWAAPSAWPGPTVYSGEKEGPTAIAQSETLMTIASLAVPTGLWVAYAKLEISQAKYQGPEAICELIGGAESGASYQIGTVGLWGTDDGVSRSFGSASFNVAREFGRGGGAFSLRCKANVPDMTAHHVRMMAMRAGSLTTVPLAGASKVTTGSAKPAVFHAFRHSNVAIASTNSFVPIGGLALPAGDWWIRADFSLRRSGNGDIPQPIICRLTAGDETDEVHARISGPGFPGEAYMVDLNVATTIASARADRVSVMCRTSVVSVEADEIHLTAMKVGALTKVALATGTSQTAGIGKPVVVHGRRSAVPVLADSFQSVGVLSLGAGKWMSSAKVSTLYGNSARCRMADGVDSDQTAEEQFTDGRTMVLQTASSANARRNVSIVCKAVPPKWRTQRESEVERIKITAIRLGVLVEANL